MEASDSGSKNASVTCCYFGVEERLQMSREQSSLVASIGSNRCCLRTSAYAEAGTQR